MTTHNETVAGDQNVAGAEASIRSRVEVVLEGLKPWLQADGGDVEFVDITDDGIVKVRLMGACGGCPMRDMTLKSGIGRALKERIPEVKDVISV